MNNTQRTESHDTLPARLLEMWDALDPVDAWRPPLKEAADEIERLQAQVAQQAAEVQRLKEHAVILAATAEEVERERLRDVMQRMAVGIEHMDKIAREWEPDHSSGSDRRGWMMALQAKHDAQKMLAARQDGAGEKP